MIVVIAFVPMPIVIVPNVPCHVGIAIPCGTPLKTAVSTHDPGVTGRSDAGGLDVVTPLVTQYHVLLHVLYAVVVDVGVAGER